MAKRKYPELVTRETTRLQNGKRRPVYVTPTPNGEIVKRRETGTGNAIYVGQGEMDSRLREVERMKKERDEEKAKQGHAVRLSGDDLDAMMEKVAQMKKDRE